MFGIGMPELVIILVIGLIIMGPKKLPEIAEMLSDSVILIDSSLTPKIDQATYFYHYLYKDQISHLVEILQVLY